MICIIQTMFMKPQTMFLPIQTVSQVIKTVSKVIKIVKVKLLFLEGTTEEQKLRKQAIINRSKRKGKELNLLISLSYRHKKTTLKGGLVPRTGIEPAHPCERQILSLLRLPIPPSGHF